MDVVPSTNEKSTGDDFPVAVTRVWKRRAYLKPGESMLSPSPNANLPLLRQCHPFHPLTRLFDASASNRFPNVEIGETAFSIAPNVASNLGTRHGEHLFPTTPSATQPHDRYRFGPEGESYHANDIVNLHPSGARQALVLDGDQDCHDLPPVIANSTAHHHHQTEKESTFKLNQTFRAKGMGERPRYHVAQRGIDPRIVSTGSYRPCEPKPRGPYSHHTREIRNLLTRPGGMRKVEVAHHTRRLQSLTTSG